MINRARQNKEQPWTSSGKSAKQIIAKALNAMSEEERYNFIRTGRKCAIIVVLALGCQRKFINYKVRHPKRTPDFELVSCNFLEISDLLRTRLQGEIPADKINDILVDLLPELIEEGMALKLMNGTYVITKSGADVSERYLNSLKAKKQE